MTESTGASSRNQSEDGNPTRIEIFHLAASYFETSPYPGKRQSKQLGEVCGQASRFAYIYSYPYGYGLIRIGETNLSSVRIGWYSDLR